MQNYEQLLDSVYAALPEKQVSGERFEIPAVDTFVEGNKTVVRNFSELCEKIRRKPAEVSKFLSKELAVPSAVEGARLLLHAKISARLVSEKFVLYCTTHVICRECKKPDTYLESHGRGPKMLVCEACGARSPVLM